MVVCGQVCPVKILYSTPLKALGLVLAGTHHSGPCQQLHGVTYPLFRAPLCLFSGLEIPRCFVLKKEEMHSAHISRASSCGSGGPALPSFAKAEP